MTSIMRIGNYELVASQTELRLKAVSVAAADGAPTNIVQFLAQVPSLVSDGIFREDGKDFVADIEGLMQLESLDHDPLAFLMNWSPWILKIEARGCLVSTILDSSHVSI